MIRQIATVHYSDGRDETVTVTQYAHAAWSRWAVREGIPLPKIAADGESAAGDMTALIMIRYLAWAELDRAGRDRPAVTFARWDALVDEVELAPAADVDPTRPAASAAG